MKKTLIALAVTAFLTSCAKTTTYVPINSCAGFSLIKASEKDTTETLRQVLSHNKTYRSICEKEQSANE